MINLENFSKVRNIFSHANCPDGKLAAYLIKKSLVLLGVPEGEINVTFLSHNQDEHQNLKSLNNSVFCDMSPRANQDDWLALDNVYILDHHDTAKELILKFGDRGVFGETSKNISGAMLAHFLFQEVIYSLSEKYKFQHISYKIINFDNMEYRLLSDSKIYKQTRDLVTSISIYDTADRSNLPVPKERWKEISLIAQALKSISFEKLDCLQLTGYIISKNYVYSCPQLIDSDYSKLLFLGDVLQEDSLRRSKELLKMGTEHTGITKDGKSFKVLVINSLSTTQVFELALEQNYDVVLGFVYARNKSSEDVVFQASLRSSSNYDVKSICEYYGGGGHTHAAGFNTKIVGYDMNLQGMLNAIIGGIVSLDVNNNMA